MNKQEFIQLLISEKVINKKIYAASLKVKDFPEARLILTKIDDNYNFNQLLNANNIVLAKTYAEDLKAELYKFIDETYLRSTIERFLIEIFDIMFPGNSKSNTNKVPENFENYKTKSETKKTSRSLSFQRRSISKTKNKEKLNKSDLHTSEIKEQKNSKKSTEIPKPKNKIKSNKRRETFLQSQRRKLSQQKGKNLKRQNDFPKRKEKSKKFTGVNKSIKIKWNVLFSDLRNLIFYTTVFILSIPLIIIFSFPPFAIILGLFGLIIWLFVELWDRYTDY